MILVTHKNQTIEIEKGLNYFEISKLFNLNDILAVKTNDDILSLAEVPKENITVDFIDCNHFYGRGIFRGGVQLLFQIALKRLFPHALVKFEHSVPGGILLEVKGVFLTTGDIDKLKTEMQKITSSNVRINKRTIRKKDGINYYKNQQEVEKALNISRITDKAITLYEIEGVHNFFYTEMPLTTGVINNYNLVFLGENRIIISFLNGSKSNNYDHNHEIIETYYNDKKWLTRMNLNYVSNLNDLVGCGTIKEVINSSELNFSLNIYKIADEIIQNKKIKYIMIAGPSSSGKTTTTERLGEYLYSKGYDPLVISSDDYFIDRDKLPKGENGEIDFESLSAIDTEYLNRDLNKLLEQKEVIVPTYDFIKGKKELKRKPVKMAGNTIFLIEGLHSLNDDLIPSVKSEEKYKIYLSPFIPINIDRHNYISSLDLRILRRMVRDNRTRGYSAEDTIYSWQNVRRGEEKHIFPFIKNANAIINTALVYEIGVLKTYVEPLLLNIEVNSPYYMEARRIINFLKPFFPITSEYVNKNSILREFIGGKND